MSFMNAIQNRRNARRIQQFTNDPEFICDWCACWERDVATDAAAILYGVTRALSGVSK